MKKFSILLVNYNGKHLLKECLNSIYASTIPKDEFEVIIVDNNSRDNSVSFLKKNYPEVLLIESEDNLGFATGNNLAYEHSSGEYIVLLNTDTTVDPDWLQQLLEAARDPQVGIVAPKLYFSTPYLPLQITSSTLSKSKIYTESDDFSPLGVLVESIETKNNPLQRSVFFQSGFYKKEKGHVETRWTNGNAVALIPIQNKTETISIALHGIPMPSQENIKVSIHTGSTLFAQATVRAKEVMQISFQIDTPTVQDELQWLVQNAGNCIFKDGHSRDRGAVIRKTDLEQIEWYDFDSEYYDQPAKLVGLCGASCLIKREVIDSIGLFNDAFFMYYEDVDFGLRAWKMGWDIQYQPKAIVYHRHRSTTDSSQKQIFFQTMVKKNYLFFLLLHFPLSASIIVLGKMLVLTLIYKMLFNALSSLNYYGKLYKSIHQKKIVYQSILSDLQHHYKEIYSQRVNLMHNQKRSQRMAQQYFY